MTVSAPQIVRVVNYTHALKTIGLEERALLPEDIPNRKSIKVDETRKTIERNGVCLNLSSVYKEVKELLHSSRGKLGRVDLWMKELKTCLCELDGSFENFLVRSVGIANNPVKKV